MYINQLRKILPLVISLLLVFSIAGTLRADVRANLFIEELTTNIAEKDLLLSLTDHLRNHVIKSGRYAVYGKESVDMNEIDFILKGSLVKIGDHYLINMRLVDRPSNETISAVRDRRSADDLLAGIEQASLSLLGIEGVSDLSRGRGKEAVPGEGVADTDMPRFSGFGFVYIHSDPPGAEVLLNDKSAGRTPRSLEMLKAGPYKIRVEQSGYFPWVQEVVVRGGSLLRLKAELKTIYGAIVFDSSPPDAEVYLEGNYQGQTPLTVGRLEGGSYGVKIQRTGFEPVRSAARVRAGETTTLSEELVEKPAYTAYRLSQERRLKKQIWAWGGLITGGLLAGKAVSDYSRSSDAYSAANDAFEGYQQSTAPSDITFYRTLSGEKRKEGDDRKSDGNLAALFSAAILGFSAYHFITLPPGTDYVETSYLMPRLHNNDLYLAWEKRY